MIYRKLSYLVIITAALALNVAAQTDKRVASIRELYERTNAMVADCEADGESSSTYLTELVINKNNGSYPAVGIFRTVAKFYYTYGDREKNPYPTRLMKIVVETKRSNRVDKSEFLFDENEKLVFYFGKNDDGEKRVYFANEKPFRILEGDKSVAANDKRMLGLIVAIQSESQKLRSIFASSLGI